MDKELEKMGNREPGCTSTNGKLYSRTGYLRRNDFFELTLESRQLDIEHILQRIRILFRMCKPVIMGSHRVNFTSDLNDQNRKNNLESLKSLLKIMTKHWPDVEFMSSDKLVTIMK